MKKIITLIIFIITLITTSTAVTLTIIYKGNAVTMNKPVGKEIELKDKGTEITGWEINTNNINLKDNKFIMPEENVTVTAHTGPVLLVDPNGETWNGSKITQTYIQEEGTTKEIGNPTVSNNTVTINANGGTTETTSITQNKTFSGWTHTGSGNLNEGTYTYGNGGGKLTANYTGKSITLPTASKSGSTLRGWYTSESGGTLIGTPGQSYTPQSDTTIYAQWEINIYTITTKTDQGAEITGIYNNKKCNSCGGKDHECEVVNIYITTENATVSE